jgi:hypothetical protein
MSSTVATSNRRIIKMTFALQRRANEAALRASAERLNGAKV